MNFKALISLTLSSLLLFFNVSPAFAASFSDLQDDHWAYKEINNLTERGIIAGYPDETFKPENNVNRAEFTKMVIEILDKDDIQVNAENTFTDITPDFWAYEDILRSKQLGLVVGYPDNTFRPYRNITKSEATSIVSKTIKKDCDNHFDCADPCDSECASPCPLTQNEGCDYEKPCSYKSDCDSECASPCPLTQNEGCDYEKPCSYKSDCDSECISPCPLTRVQNKDCILSRFEDHEKIAKWAKKSFKNAIKNELYVNYPDRNNLTPNKDMTRAETAALLYKLRENPSVLTAEFQGPEIQQSIEEEKILSEANYPKKLKVEEYKRVIEHLPANAYSGNVNEVEIQGSKAVILAHNVVPVNFEGGFKAKKAAEGELVNLTFIKNLQTEEGTKLIPTGSKLVAQITELKNGRLFHRNGKVDLEITNLVLPSGEVYPLTATIENAELFDKKFGKCNYKRLGIVGGSITAFGSLLGLFIGAVADETGEGAALGSIIGVGTGLIIGLIAPGCSIKIPEDQKIYVKLERDLEIDVK